jgi:hypothetical protein
MIEPQDPDHVVQRRRFARRPMQLQAKLRVGKREIEAVTENISPGGAFMHVALPATATEVIASIGLPHGRDLHVRAKIRWRRASPPGIGVEFEMFLEG